MGNTSSTQNNVTAGGNASGDVSNGNSTNNTISTTTTRQANPTEIADLKKNLATTITNATQLRDLLNTLPTKIDFSSNLSTAITNYKAQQLNPIEKFTNYSNYYLNENTSRPDDSLLFKAHNNALSLVDDPLGRNQAAFDTYIYLQNKKINDLNAKINEVNSLRATTSNQPEKIIKSIKNLDNSKILYVQEYAGTQSTTTTVPVGTSTSANANKIEQNGNPNKNYLIFGNNGCLSYNPEFINDKNLNNFKFEKCNANDINQQFILSQINDQTNYNNLVDSKSQIASDISTSYGFYAAIPYNNYILDKDKNDRQCVTINDEGLTIQKCNLDYTQRFKAFY